MRATEVLERVLGAGGRVVAGKTGPRLMYPTALKPLVQEHRHELRALLSEAILNAEHGDLGELLARLLSLRLSEFERETFSIELSLPWNEESIWLAPDLDQAKMLVAHGIGRGRIFTACEFHEWLAMLTNEPDIPPLVASAKIALGGRITGVWPREVAARCSAARAPGGS